MCDHWFHELHVSNLFHISVLRAIFNPRSLRRHNKKTLRYRYAAQRGILQVNLETFEVTSECVG